VASSVFDDPGDLWHCSFLLVFGVGRYSKHHDCKIVAVAVSVLLPDHSMEEGVG
jgi:hypothetical protein